MAPRVVFATGNRGKVREIAELLGGRLDLVPQTDLAVPSIEETGDSFAANALLKARHAAAVTGLPALADDSGLEVDALGGAPGVYSARYAGDQATDEDNVAHLLAELAGVAPTARTARFRCVLALVRSADDAAPLVAEAAWEGSITAAPRGTGGFGYDPVFEVPGLGRTSAELAPADKNSRSHRGLAARRLRALLDASPGFLEGL
jgi:XTP/dITP diphosphohydrolase